MSRRDGRDSDTRRHRSRFDQEPSPKRSRRDGKPETERTLGDVRSDERDHLSGDQKHRRRLQDAVPLEAPSKEVSKEEVITNKESDKAHPNREGQKYSSDPTEVPRSRSFFQHDERGNSGVAGRSFKHRTSAEGGWKEQQIGGAKTRDERIRSHARDNDTWRHDKYLETEADPKPPARKRPSFREEKIPNESGKGDKSVVAEPVKTTNASEQPGLENERRDERGGNGSSRHLDRPERPGGNSSRGETNNNIGGEARRGGDFPPRGRYGGYGSGSGSYNHREREQQLVVGREGRGYHHVAGGGGGGGGRVEKWKHDLFYEANRSPSPKNEDDAIAKVEALLAS